MPEFTLPPTILKGKPERHDALDLVRGFAALAVAQYHFMSWNNVANIESMGTFAVYMFFILSGLTMMMVYGDRFVQGVDRSILTSFYRKRLARLLPLLLVVSALSFLKAALNGESDFAAAVLTGTGLMFLHMPGFLSNSVGAWSLGIEFAFYAVFPVIAVMARSAKAMAVWTAMLLAVQHLLLWKIKGADDFWPLYVSNLTFAPFFAMGILIYLNGAKRAPWGLPVCLALMISLIGFSAVVPTDLMTNQPAYFLLTLVAALTVYSAWRSDTPEWAKKPAAFFGNISYSLYLTHWIGNDIAREVFGRYGLAVQWLAFCALAVSGAYLTYRWFERPARDILGKRRQEASGYVAVI